MQKPHIPTLVSTAASVAIMLSVSAAHAHGVWVAERFGETAIVYGEGPSDDKYKPEKVKKVQFCTAADACSVIEPTQSETYSVLPKPETDGVFVVDFLNGFWTKDGAGKWANKPKSAVDDPQDSVLSQKYNVTIMGHWPDGLGPLGNALEIVPMADPAALNVGDTFEVQVLLDGKPLADATVTADFTGAPDAFTSKTNAEGKADVTIRNGGLNVLGVGHAVPLGDAHDADRLSYEATLAFTLAGK